MCLARLRGSRSVRVSDEDQLFLASEPLSALLALSRATLGASSLELLSPWLGIEPIIGNNVVSQAYYVWYLQASG